MLATTRRCRRFVRFLQGQVCVSDGDGPDAFTEGDLAWQSRPARSSVAAASGNIPSPAHRQHSTQQGVSQNELVV